MTMTDAEAAARRARSKARKQAQAEVTVASAAAAAQLTEDYEAETLARALDGDADAGREALRLCATGLDHGNLSAPLAAYLAERLALIDKALDDTEALRKIKKSSGSVRSSRDAAIAEALCIKRPAKKPSDPLPQWQIPYAAFGVLLLKGGARPEAVKGAMDEARQRLEGAHASLHRREAERILMAYLPLHSLDCVSLLELAGDLREILPTFLPQAKQP